MAPASPPPNLPEEQLLVQIASYNTALQGSHGLPQNLVDWLAPTLQVSTFLSRSPRAPDIVAVGFQELLPLHLGLSGVSSTVINNRAEHIRTQIEEHAPKGEKFTLLSKIVHVGIALLVYAKDDGVARRVCDVHTAYTGCGPGWMGNKGAVGVRFRVRDNHEANGETYTFVCAHLTAHTECLKNRLIDYNHIVGSLLFPSSSTIYDTSHLFFLGDLNFRVTLPKGVQGAWDDELARGSLKEYDQLLVERRKGTTMVGLREGDFWKFKCSYKYHMGEVDKYNDKRTPSWTDRILYATYTDSPDTPDQSNIRNLLYTSVPSYTTSDHKPVVSLLLLPAPSPASTGEKVIRLPKDYHPAPDPRAGLKKLVGNILDKLVGITWWMLTIIGAGSAAVGVFNFLIGMAAWRWWSARPSLGTQGSAEV